MYAKAFVFITLLCLETLYVTAQVKIGAAGTPHPNAVLELDGGTNKGLLLPRLSNTQMADLVSAPNGMIIFSTTDGFLYIRKGGVWQKITDATSPVGGGGFNLPYDGSASSPSRLFSITNNSNGDAIWGVANSSDGITGLSTSGKGGYFSSTSGVGGFFSSINGVALVTDKGNVGIGNSNPGYLLDVNGRMRLRHVGDNVTAGVWFNKSNNTEAAFTGMINDSTFGFFGNGTVGNWQVGIDVKNAMVGIGNTDPTAPLSFNNATGDKMDIFYSSPTARYGIGLQAGLMQLYTASVADDIAFGFGSSAAFTERMRVKGNGNVGIGIMPTEKLEIRTGLGEIGWKHSWAGGSLVSTAPTFLTAATIRSNSAAVQLTTNANVGLYIKTDGTIGAGINNPTRQLDVNSRMRIRGTANNINNSAGIYFDGVTDIERAFVGIETNDKIGIFGAGSGWGLSMNVNTGNTNLYNSVAIGTTAVPNSKLQVAGSLSLPLVEVTNNYAVSDNDYAIRMVIAANTDVERIITLPAANGRAGRIYKIYALIPLSGPAAAGTYTPSSVALMEAGTNINILFDNGITSNLVNHIYRFSSLDFDRIFKLSSVTIQSNGTKWKVIDENFITLNDSY